MELGLELDLEEDVDVDVDVVVVVVEEEEVVVKLDLEAVALLPVEDVVVFLVDVEINLSDVGEDVGEVKEETLVVKLLLSCDVKLEIGAKALLTAVVLLVVKELTKMDDLLEEAVVTDDNVNEGIVKEDDMLLVVDTKEICDETISEIEVVGKNVG